MSEIILIATKYYKLLLVAVKVTIILSICAVLLGLVLGIVLAIMKLCRYNILKWIANVYVEFIRGTPVIIQVALVYYGLPVLGITFPMTNLGGFRLDQLISGIIALGMNSGAVICEIVRGGILSVDQGQTEASLSLGFNTFSTMRLIVLPQAIKNILPSLGNEFVNMIKTSSQVYVIGLAELMYTANMIRSSSFMPFTPLVVVALIYFVLTFTVSNLVKLLEHRMNRSTRD